MQEDQGQFVGVYRNLIKDVGMISMQCLSCRICRGTGVKRTGRCDDFSPCRETPLLLNHQGGSFSLAVTSPAGKQSPTESASTVMKYFMCIVVSLYYKLLPGVILLIAYLFHPRHTFAVQPFAYGEMRHGGIRGRAVPVLDVGRTQHHVPLPDDLYRASPFLGQPDAECNEQGLAQRVGVPVVRAPGSKVTWEP